MPFFDVNSSLSIFLAFLSELTLEKILRTRGRYWSLSFLDVSIMPSRSSFLGFGIPPAAITLSRSRFEPGLY